MRLGLKGLKVFAPQSEHHNQVCDLLIENGTIKEIGQLQFGNDVDVHSFSGESVSTGWVDLRANFSDPGFEHREDLKSGTSAAMAGGVTTVGVEPDTKPLIATKGDTDYIRSFKSAVRLLPLASFIKSYKSTELTDLVDLSNAGAVAFCQLNRTWLPDDVILKVLEYGKVSGRRIHLHASNFHFINEAFVHEGEVNINLGLRGLPSLSEELNVDRMLKLAAYADAPIHIMNVSSKEAVRLIETAKSMGQNVSADTSVYNLLYTDRALELFDTSYKLDPPLRGSDDLDALINGVANGVIDGVSSNHSPLEDDLKKCELPLAEFGSIGVQTLFPLLLKALKGDEHMTIDILSRRNRLIYEPELSLSVGSQAELSIFDARAEWVFDAKSNRSKSSNSMVWNQSLKGNATAVVSNGKIHFS